jgi:hypothetical protein
MQAIFSDENEPFWRSTKRLELGLIAPECFAPFLASRFAESGRGINDDATAHLLEITGGHPYATQELSYFVWQRIGSRRTADRADVDAALGDVLRSEDSHFTTVWERSSAQQRSLLAALARESGRPLSNEFRRRHSLPTASSVQRALHTLEGAELIARDGGCAWISEPFLADWLRSRGF